MQHQAPAPDPGDVIKAAIRFAGGREKVAEAFGITWGSVNAWGTRRTLPAHYVRRLSEMGGGVITVDQLLAAIERTAQERAAA